MKYSNFRLGIVGLIVVCTVLIDTSWKIFVEQSARQVARYNVENIKNCVTEVVKINGNTIDVSNADVEKAMKACALKTRITETSDVFAVDLKSLEFVFDPSLDCYVEGGKALTVESECSLHKDQVMCKSVLPLLLSGYDSTQHTKVSWKFNDGKEYLEWAVAPSESKGFDGVTRGGSSKPHQILIVQGVVEKELWDRYCLFRLSVYLIGFLSIIINLLYAVHEYQKEERLHRRDCD